MSENPRDTQFAGFAALVLKEIDDAIGRQTKEALEHGLSGKDEKRFANELGVIIARRAYDLALHVVNETIGIGNTAKDFVSSISDPAELPTEE